MFGVFGLGPKDRGLESHHWASEVWEANPWSWWSHIQIPIIYMFGVLESHSYYYLKVRTSKRLYP